MVSNPAYRCETCRGVPLWCIERYGDVATSWACADHLSVVCEALQRDWEVTALKVELFAKACEWSGIGATLNAIAKEES